LPDEARVMTTHLHAPWRAAVVPPLSELRRERMTAEPPIMQSIYAAQSLRIRGLDSLIVRELTGIYVERDSLIAQRRARWSSVEGYDSEFLKAERAFLPPDLHVAVALPLSEQNTSQTARKPVALQWFVASATGGEPKGKLHVWKYEEGLAALPQAPDEIFWLPGLLSLDPNLLSFGLAQADYAETVRLDPPSKLRLAQTTLDERPLFDHSRQVLGMYLENSSSDTLYLVYRQTTPFERSITTVISRWPKGARIAIIILFLVGLVGAYAFYELKQREARRLKIAEEMAVDLDKARQVQEKLLPTGPMDVKGLEVFGLHQSMQSVGGDYYDFFPLADGRVLICVADVAGHGLAAAMLMSNLQATLHAIAETPRPINELVAMLNQEITKRTSPERFVTLIMAEISADRSQLTICNAGHNPGYLIRKNGKIEELDAGGIMLGVMEMFPFIQMDYSLEPGDVIALYTDGIPEAEIGLDDMFGYDRLQYFFSEHRDERLQDIAQKLFRKVTMDGTSAIDDDMAVVLVRMKLRK
jgi:serine phosphatase RsbU (regulator of sigma subunit)